MTLQYLAIKSRNGSRTQFYTAVFCENHSSRVHVRMVRILFFERYVRILTYFIEGYVKGTVR